MLSPPLLYMSLSLKHLLKTEIIEHNKYMIKKLSTNFHFHKEYFINFIYKKINLKFLLPSSLFF